MFRAGGGHGHGPLLPGTRRLPVGLALRPRRGRPPARIPGNTYKARYVCNIPRSASPDAPARPSLYGHGLFGDAGEAGARNVEELGNENDVLVCAADWIGMAEEDVGERDHGARDLSASRRSPTGSSRASSTSCSSGRTMIHPDGLASNPAFQWTAGR